MKDVVVICTYKRNELLYCCLKRVREADAQVPILLFPDRGTWKDRELQSISTKFSAEIVHVPDHDHYGNSWNAGEALRYVYHAGFELVHYLEDDAFVKPDFFTWTRQGHENFNDIFCSAGWVFNLHSPLDSGDYFVPWLYIPQFSIKRDKLALIYEHLGPKYYTEMQGYIEKHFKGNVLNKMYTDILHFEIDGLIQRIIFEDRSQVLWPSIAKVEHMGFGGYNRGGYERYEEFFSDFSANTLTARVEAIESVFEDVHWRANVFGKSIIEREIGAEIVKREFVYRIELPGGWTSEYKSDLRRALLPRRINSVNVPHNAEIVLA